MYLCIYICIYIYVYMHIYIYICIYIYIYICMYMYMWLGGGVQVRAGHLGRCQQAPVDCGLGGVYICIHMCMYIYIYIYIYICIYIRVYIYIYIHMERERERERYMYLYMCIHICIHIYTHMYICIEREMAARGWARSTPGCTPWAPRTPGNSSRRWGNYNTIDCNTYYNIRTLIQFYRL